MPVSQTRPEGRAWIGCVHFPASAVTRRRLPVWPCAFGDVQGRLFPWLFWLPEENRHFMRTGIIILERMGQWKVMFVVRQPGFAETLKRIPFFGFKTRRRMWNRWSFFRLPIMDRKRKQTRRCVSVLIKAWPGPEVRQKMRCMVLFTGFLWWMVCQ